MGTFRIEPSKFNGVQLRIAPAVKSIDKIAESTAYTQKIVPHSERLNDLIAKLAEPVFQKMEPFLKRVSLPSGEYLYRPEEKIDYLYFPETAVISELQILEDGRTIEVSIIGRDGVVGISTLYFSAPAANWVQVCGSGTALKVKRETLERFARADRSTDILFHEYIHLYIAQISQKVACNAHHSVEERFCTWLLSLQDRCPRGRLKLTQEHVARILGVYRPSVTCIAQQLREQGLIDYVRGNIVILDREKLKERACGCYIEMKDATSVPRQFDRLERQNGNYVF